MEDEEDVGTPQLGYVPKENTMSFGMVGQKQYKPPQVLLSEQSEDFYTNTARSNYTKMSSQASVEIKGLNFASNAPIHSQPQTEVNVF